MPTGYQIYDQEKPYYLTLQIIEWVDVFTRKSNREVIVNALNFCIEQKGLEVFAYVIMSNHLHLIVRSNSANLSGTIRDFKSFTSKEILKNVIDGNESRKEWILSIFKNAARKHKRNSEYQVWTHENHAKEIISNHFFDQKLNYIHNNPVRAGLVEYPEEYLYSSAPNYAGKKGMVNVLVEESI